MDYSEGSSIVVGTSFHSGKPLGDGSFIILFYFWIFFCWFFPYSLGFSRCISKARSDVNSIRIQLRCRGERRAVLQRCQLIIARQWIVYQLKALWGYLHIQAAHLHVDVAAMMNGLACATDVNGPCPNRRRRRRPIINGPSVTWRVTKRRPLTTAIVITRSLDFVYRHRSAAVAFKQIELSGIVVNMEVGKGPNEVDVFCFWLHRFQRKTLLENSYLKNKKKIKKKEESGQQQQKKFEFSLFLSMLIFLLKMAFFRVRRGWKMEEKSNKTQRWYNRGANVFIDDLKLRRNAAVLFFSHGWLLNGLEINSNFNRKQTVIKSTKAPIIKLDQMAIISHQ